VDIISHRVGISPRSWPCCQNSCHAATFALTFRWSLPISEGCHCLHMWMQSQWLLWKTSWSNIWNKSSCPTTSLCKLIFQGSPRSTDCWKLVSNCFPRCGGWQGAAFWWTGSRCCAKLTAPSQNNTCYCTDRRMTASTSAQRKKSIHSLIPTKGICLSQLTPSWGRDPGGSAFWKGTDLEPRWVPLVGWTAWGPGPISLLVSHCALKKNWAPAGSH
jgi:hypothetical protein